MSDTTYLSDEINVRLALGAHDPYQFLVATLMLFLSSGKADPDTQASLVTVIDGIITNCELDQATVHAAEDEVIAFFAAHGVEVTRLRER